MQKITDLDTQPGDHYFSPGQLSATVDWIAVTDHNKKGGYPGMSGPVKNRGGLSHYNSGAVYKETGLLCLWHTNRPEMGLHVIYTGETLRAIYLLGLAPDDLVKQLVASQTKFTRLDLAIDALDCPINLDAIKQAVKERRYEGRKKLWRNIESSDDGYSLYIGERVQTVRSGFTTKRQNRRSVIQTGNAWRFN